jgi:arylformamidase
MSSEIERPGLSRDIPSRTLYDITPPIKESLKVWPGDTPPRREPLMELERGDSVTLSTLHTTVHLGAHADAPSHYGPDAPGIDERPIDLYLGNCQVMRLNVGRCAIIVPGDLTGRIEAERVLFATGTFPDSTQFNEDFAALHPDLIEHLHGRGVRLVGVDTPSIDPFHSKELPSHRAVLRHDLAVLEGLDLAGVPDGFYELIALPLRLVGFDASPVRAILRSLES